MPEEKVQTPELEVDEIIDFSNKESLLPSLITDDTDPPKPPEEPPEDEDKKPAEPETEETPAEEPAADTEDSGDAEETEDEEVEDFPSIEDDSEVEKEEEEEEEEEEEAPATAKRDYSGFDEDDIDWLKKAPNHVFAKASQRLKELYTKAESPGNAASAYESPNAFLLSPEYHQAANQAQEFSAVSQHWQMQLANIEAGQKWTTLGRDQNGRLTVTGEQEATPQAKAAVLAALTEAQQLSTQAQGKVQNIQQNYHAQFTNSKKALNDVMDKYIKQLPSVIQPSKKDIGVLKNHIPAEFKEHPMADLASKIYGVAKRQQHYIKQLQQKQARGSKLAKAKDAAPEKTGRVKQATPKVSDDEIDFSEISKEFKKYKDTSSIL